jgi:hypothetical protein
MIDSMDYTVGSLVKVRGREWVVLPDSSEDLLRPLGGQLPAFEREQRVARLGTFPRRLLVATDCLSEGVNLQDHFNAVVHYDLSWNPTRHEQREGRVDRYGQPSSTVRTLTYYGVDNQIDGIVLEVLLRKHRTIRSSLGISVAVPASTQEVVQALMQGVMLRGKKILGGGQLNFLDVDSGFGSAQLAELNAQWENATEKERISRTLFAQSTLDAQEVAQEWAAMRDAIGSGVDVRSFVTQAVQLHGGTVSPEPALDCWRVLLPEGALQDAAHGERILLARFELPVSDSALYLSRTHPLIEDLAAYVVSGALDPVMGGLCPALRGHAHPGRHPPDNAAAAPLPPPSGDPPTGAGQPDARRRKPPGSVRGRTRGRTLAVAAGGGTPALRCTREQYRPTAGDPLRWPGDRRVRAASPPPCRPACCRTRQRTAGRAPPRAGRQPTDWGAP